MKREIVVNGITYVKKKKSIDYDSWIIKELSEMDGWWMTAVPILGWITTSFVICIFYPIKYALQKDGE